MAEIKAILRRHFQLSNERGQTFFNCLFFQFCLKIQKKTEKKLNLVYSERDGTKNDARACSNRFRSSRAFSNDLETAIPLDHDRSVDVSLYIFLLSSLVL